MLGFFNALKKDMQLEEKLLKEYKDLLAKAPSGSLVCYRKNGKVYYRHVLSAGDPDSGRLLTTQRNLRPSASPADARLLTALAEKAYARRMVRTLKHNLLLQKKLAESYQSYRFEKIRDQLGKAYQEVALQSPLGFHADLTREIAEKQANASKHAVHPENLTQPTLAGFKVRSKSETIISNLMTERGILFVYEEPLRLYVPGEGWLTLHPDFVIYLPDGSIVVWEHLGLLQDEAYLAAFAKKLQLYHKAGFAVGSTLYLTSDTASGRLDMDAVLHVIDCLKAMGA